MLLAWDWNGRIADFGQNNSLNNPEIPSVTHRNTRDDVLFIDSDYFAPE
jgi:hypothetical protein